MSTIASNTATPAGSAPDANERVEEFKAEVARLQLKDPATARERQLLLLGVIGMVLGIVLAVVAYFGSHNTTNALSQRDMFCVAMIGVACSVVGGALFLRYSMANFLRFWLARLIYEMHNNATDKVSSGS